jgi:hypothetical protein
MAQKDIYKIDNYFITIGWILVVVGALFMALDFSLWNEVTISETKGNGTHYYFEAKNGRTLDQIKQEKGEGFEVEERSFPIVRVVIAVNGIILLLIGYTYRSREKKIISVWRALEQMGEAKVVDLSMMLGLPREFIIKHLKDINAQHQTIFSYDMRSDKIINSKLMSEFLVLVDCISCGNKINQKVSLDLSNPPRCQYCGTGVPADDLNKLKQEVLLTMQQVIPVPPGKGEFSTPLFIVLLIVFWPAAVAYVIVKKTSASTFANLQASVQALGNQPGRQS